MTTDKKILRLSLRVVVIGGVVAGLLIPMSLATFYSSSQQRSRLLSEAQAAHARVTDVMALGVQKALWDLSPEAAAPLAKSVMDDPRIVATVIRDAQGAVFLEEKQEGRRVGTILTLEKPIVNGDQTIGKVEVVFSLASAEEAIAQRMLETLMVSFIQAFACIAILVALLNKRVLARIATLKHQAQLLASKSLDQPFSWQETDEIGELGVSLESTRRSLQDLFGELERKNADLAGLNANLEGLVAERTATIKMILDHVRSGFLLVGENFVVREGYTRSCESLLATTEISGRSLTEILKLDGGAAVHFEMSVEQVFSDIMPEEVNLSQIPQRFKIGDKTLSLEGSTIRDEQGKIQSILFTVIDVTLLEQTEKENRASRAMVRILQNIASFRDFVRESHERLNQAQTALAGADEKTVRRELHTLKGNSSAFGLEDLAAVVHAVEDEVRVADDHLRYVEKAFKSFLDERFDLLKIRFNGEEEEPHYTITEHDLNNLMNALLAIKVPVSSSLASQIGQQWATQVRRVPISSLLGPIESYVQTLAQQRGKEVQFVMDGGNLRVDAQQVKSLTQNLVHLLRNSIDHGIEGMDERDGKDPKGTLRLGFVEVDDHLQVSISDDGRGIDHHRVLKKAIERGIVTPEQAQGLTPKQACSLIFADGLSTAEYVTSTSGRGVGMSAVKEAVEKQGGHIEIVSTIGRGTTFKIDWPLNPVESQPIRRAS